MIEMYANLIKLWSNLLWDTSLRAGKGLENRVGKDVCSNRAVDSRENLKRRYGSFGKGVIVFRCVAVAMATSASLLQDRYLLRRHRKCNAYFNRMLTAGVLTSYRSYQETQPAWDLQEIMSPNSELKPDTKTCVDTTPMSQRTRATMMWLKEIPLSYAKRQRGN